MSDQSAPSPNIGLIYTKEALTDGKPASLQCVDIGGQTFAISRGWLTIARLEDEWYEDIDDPMAVFNALEKLPASSRPDLFTFWQRLPSIEPKHPYHLEWEDWAVLPITSYKHWWTQQIRSRVRNLIRKSEKEGVVIKETIFDDDFIRGITAIFNESPIRQGRRFWHYGKDFETIKSQFSRYLFRETMIGAYYQGEMIGFIMFGDAGRFGITGQIISSLKHRDKAPNNALIAKAVELCEKRSLNYLVYLFWSDDSLAEFKRRCGFQKVGIPRYYIPLTLRGRLALMCGIHRGWKKLIPKPIKASLKRFRATFYRVTRN
ncbi:MAG: hypothetical protein ACU843_12185 [Gammaproteobacteria bacterium]